jgi:biopolymer transport protein TolQ
MHAGMIVQLVLYVLFAFSVLSWGIIFSKTYQLYITRRSLRRFRAAFAQTQDLATLYTTSENLSSSPMIRVFQTGYEEWQRRLTHARQFPTLATVTVDTETGERILRAMQREIREQAAWLERTLGLLATTASTTPFIGLFGTVLGIIEAFQGLSVAQSTSIQAIAPGIADALIATAVGLFAAIPAVMAFNHFSGEVQRLTTEMENFTVDFVNRVETASSLDTPPARRVS